MRHSSSHFTRFATRATERPETDGEKKGKKMHALGVADQDGLEPIAFELPTRVAWQWSGLVASLSVVKVVR